MENNELQNYIDVCIEKKIEEKTAPIIELLTTILNFSYEIRLHTNYPKEDAPGRIAQTSINMKQNLELALQQVNQLREQCGLGVSAVQKAREELKGW